MVRTPPLDVKIDIVVGEVPLPKVESSRSCGTEGVVSIEYRVHEARDQAVYQLHLVQGRQACIGKCDVDGQSVFLRPGQDLFPLYPRKKIILKGFEDSYTRVERQGELVKTIITREFKFVYPEVGQGAGRSDHASSSSVYGLIEIDVHEKDTYEVPSHVRRSTRESHVARDTGLHNPRDNRTRPSRAVVPMRSAAAEVGASDSGELQKTLYNVDGTVVGKPQKTQYNVDGTVANLGSTSSGGEPAAPAAADCRAPHERQIATKPGAAQQKTTSRPMTPQTTKPRVGRLLCIIKIHYSADRQPTLNNRAIAGRSSGEESADALAVQMQADHALAVQMQEALEQEALEQEALEQGQLLGADDEMLRRILERSLAEQ